MRTRSTRKPTPPTRRRNPTPGRPRRAAKLPLNPWLKPWRGPLGGLPSFAALTVATLPAALRSAMVAQRHEVRAIVGSKRPATFANTLLALEKSGSTMARVGALFGLYTSALATADVQAIERTWAPKLAAFADEMTFNRRLFARIAQVYRDRHRLREPDALRLVENTYDAYVRRGALLRGTPAKRLAAINLELASAYTEFGQNALADEETLALELSASELGGIPAGLVAAAAAEGGWRFANTRSVIEPLLMHAHDRSVRERAWRLFYERGTTPGRDNRPLGTRILALRAERAQLLGFASPAHQALAANMARTPDAALAALMAVWPHAVAAAQTDIAAMQLLLATDAGPRARIEPWDYRYYAERVRAASAFDDSALTPYLMLDSMRDGMFWMAQQLYGIRFRRVRAAPAYHPDAEVYEVTRGRATVGIFVFDPFARPGKRSGAWMSELRTYCQVGRHTTPIVTNTANFTKSPAGQPALLSWDDVTTLFHEFGHALHGLLTRARFPSLAGTNTRLDFVELPSQLHEHWAATPELLERFARHHATGAPLPETMRAQVAAARRVGQGFRTVEYLAAAIYDMRVHLAAANGPIDLESTERQLMAELQCPPAIVMRHRPAHFAHIFSGDGYAAGYYAYLWADVLVADAAEAFAEAGSLYHRGTARRLQETILEAGDSVAPDAAYLAFRGRAPDPSALLRDRGLG